MALAKTFGKTEKIAELLFIFRNSELEILKLISCILHMLITLEASLYDQIFQTPVLSYEVS